MSALRGKRGHPVLDQRPRVVRAGPGLGVELERARVQLGERQPLEPEERARETMALQLRRCEGVHRPSFRRQTGFELDALAGPALVRHADLGLLLDDGNSVRLSRQGKYVADAVIQGLL